MVTGVASTVVSHLTITINFTIDITTVLELDFLGILSFIDKSQNYNNRFPSDRILCKRVEI